MLRNLFYDDDLSYSDGLFLELRKLLESLDRYVERPQLINLEELYYVMREVSEKQLLVRCREILNSWIREEVPQHEQLWDVLLTDTLKSIGMILCRKDLSHLHNHLLPIYCNDEAMYRKHYEKDVSDVFRVETARDLHKAVTTIYSFLECYRISLSFRACFDLKSFSAKPGKNCIRNLRGTLSDPYSRARPENELAIRLMEDIHGFPHYSTVFMKSNNHELPFDLLADIQVVINKAWEAIITSSASGSCHSGGVSTAVQFISVSIYTQLSIKLKRGSNSMEKLLLVEYGVPNSKSILESMLEILQQGFCQLVKWKDQNAVLHKQLKFLKYFLNCLPVEFTTNRYWSDVSFTTKVTISRQAIHLFLSCYYGNDNTLWEEANNLMTQTIETISMFERESLRHHSRTKYDFESLDYCLEKLEILMSHSMISTLQNVKNHQIAKALEEMISINASIHRISDSREEYKTLTSLCNQVGHVACALGYIVHPLLDESLSVPHLTLWFSDLENDVRLIKEKVNEISENNRSSNQEHDVTRASNYKSSHEDETMIDEEIVGFVDEENHVIDHIVRGSKDLAKVLIAGMPGLGKTTLAKKVYNNQIVVDHFDVRSWCCVSELYQKKSLLVQILKHVTPLEEGVDEDSLGEKLWKKLKRSRYLIIMDDIWDITAWNDLRRCFPDDQNGSRILFTSRFNDLSLQCTKIHFLNPLSDDDSWELLQKKLRLTEDWPSEFLEIGDRIAKGCKGVPLVVVLVAGLLADKNLDQWQKVACNVTSYVLNDSQRQCADILEMSYKNLPYYLKPCFLYLGCFPPDSEISSTKLIQLWTAEGFIERRIPNDVECIAEGYLMDLRKRNLIEVAERRSLGGIKTCRVHDLIHDFCSSKGKEEMFVCRITDAAGAERKQSRRLGIIYDWGKDSADWSSYLDVHSLFFYSKIETDSVGYIFENCKLLRVLDLMTPSLMWDMIDLPDAIGLLVHLRFLAGPFCSVPTNIVKLTNLVTFRMFVLKTDKICLPVNFKDLARLRHLRINAATMFTAQHCVPEHPFNSLQTLSTLLLPAFGGTILTSFPSLRKLKCLFVNIKDRITYPEFNLLTRLESLVMTYLLGDQDESVPLDATKWEFSFPPSIRKLTLKMFCLPWREMSIIKELPNLEVLKLDRSAFVGENWNVGDDVFPKLKYLRLRGLNIKKWEALRDNFPRLENLVVQGCKYLEEIPADFENLLILKMIEVSGCNSSVEASAREIHEEQVESQNVELKVLARDNDPNKAYHWSGTVRRKLADDLSDNLSDKWQAYERELYDSLDVNGCTIQ